ncbi:transcriptional regulator LysR family (plasmid) [Cupriavidus necator N-1]|uniref:Transcriptional regulator LysR family n=1 Tax=Cupriavidus necator (strain ATCC 43291 / DSM 13513 / CCUG 52238 / LMG 8453 / N-1) TaxID=1042878 RepID=F8GUP2_CUPNN|nr:LysR family transcriptional regulator [Cupriavidus necator]AEI82446.1 transcriptional regulator LysR family [Cupriavidus necator N-1]MDX6007452.1 LysR family transcriptional regulator [Cupriavidus necator]
MFTIKQLETFYWVGRLGTIAKAADKLHVTQSAVTKRLQELEASVAAPLFERESRKNLLTPAGKELLIKSEHIFEMLDRLEKMKGSTQQPARILHVGLGELTALTWFPSFLKRMKDVYPSVTVQPEIDMSSLLLQKVKEGRLDFAILPDLPDADDLVRVPVGNVQFGWFAGPGKFAVGETQSLHDLASQPVVEQSEHSIINRLCASLWEGAGVRPERLNGGNNIAALAGLVAAGVGISCLPVALFEDEIAQGRLQLVKTHPPAPSVAYACYFLKYPHSALGYSVAEIAKQTCTFPGAGSSPGH